MNQNMLENMWKIMKENNFDYSDIISSDLKCTICKKILIDACDAPCGCCFCKSCINEYLNEDRRKCPGQSEYCDDYLLDINKDIHISRVINMRISKLSVRCPNIDCRSQVELRMMDKHLRICDDQQSCPYLEIGCGEKSLSKEQVKDHVSMEMFSHSKLMKIWMSNCKNEMNSLKRDVDKLRTENAKCKEKMRIDEDQSKEIIQLLSSQARENASEIHRLNDEMCALKNSNRSIKEELKTVKYKHGKEISHLKVEIENQCKEIDQLKEKCQLMEVRDDEIQEKLVNNDVNPLIDKSLIDSSNQNVQNKLDKMSQLCDEIRVEAIKSIENIQEIVDQSMFREFYWLIDDWSQRLDKARKTEAKIIFSKPILSHKTGYKFCLSAEPDFHKDNLKINFVIVKSPNDDNLRWPFDKDLQFSLVNVKISKINQYTISSDRTRIFSYILSPDDAAFQKPTIDKNPPLESFLYIPLREILATDDFVMIKLTMKPPSIYCTTE